jgi:uncharacterized protein
MTTRADSTTAFTPACRICGKPVSAEHRPFCSPRCRNIDLGRWLKGNYKIETDEPPDESSGETQ